MAREAYRFNQKCQAEDWCGDTLVSEGKLMNEGRQNGLTGSGSTPNLRPSIAKRSLFKRERPGSGWDSTFQDSSNTRISCNRQGRNGKVELRVKGLIKQVRVKVRVARPQRGHRHRTVGRERGEESGVGEATGPTAYYSFHAYL